MAYLQCCQSHDWEATLSYSADLRGSWVRSSSHDEQTLVKSTSHAGHWFIKALGSYLARPLLSNLRRGACEAKVPPIVRKENLMFHRNVYVCKIWSISVYQPPSQIPGSCTWNLCDFFGGALCLREAWKMIARAAERRWGIRSKVTYGFNAPYLKNWKTIVVLNIHFEYISLAGCTND